MSARYVSERDLIPGLQDVTVPFAQHNREAVKVSSTGSGRVA